MVELADSRKRLHREQVRSGQTARRGQTLRWITQRARNENQLTSCGVDSEVVDASLRGGRCESVRTEEGVDKGLLCRDIETGANLVVQGRIVEHIRGQHRAKQVEKEGTTAA